ncbi:MAG: diguanylate cyclase [Alteromonadaceae bacterium]|nr:diguanylate cyclase [Alteromonadaceae bacterium]
MFKIANQPRETLSKRRFRYPAQLQWFALLAALMWVVGALLVCRELVTEKLNQSLQLSQHQLDNETSLIARVFDQNLHQAEQLSRTLSFDRSYWKVLKDSQLKNDAYSSMDITGLREHIFNLENAVETNEQFKTIEREINVNQVFMLDNKGYCVASGRSGKENDCLGTHYDNRQYFVTAKAEGTGRQFAIGRVHSVPSFFFATAIADKDNFLGVIVLRVLTSDVVDFIRLDRSLTLVTGEDGVVIAGSEPDAMFNHIGMALSPLPDMSKYRSLYKKNTLQPLPLHLATNNMSDHFAIWLWQNQRHLMSKQEVESGDFYIYRFTNIESAFARARNHWTLSIVTVVAGLLIILLVERSLNFSAQRKLHLAQMSKTNQQLSEASKKLYEQTITDHLTGLYNRRYFNERLNKEVNRRNEHTSPQSNNGEPLSILSIDVDRFKQINDRYGHLAGDKALKTIAEICKASVRPSDVVARIGGEEFAILLPGIDKMGAQALAERILHKCAATEINFEQSRFKQTCSIGLAQLTANQTSTQLLSQADEALYLAKNRGRNRFVIAE